MQQALSLLTMLNNFGCLSQVKEIRVLALKVLQRVVVKWRENVDMVRPIKEGQLIRALLPNCCNRTRFSVYHA